MQLWRGETIAAPDPDTPTPYPADLRSRRKD